MSSPVDGLTFALELLCALEITKVPWSDTHDSSPVIISVLNVEPQFPEQMIKMEWTMREFRNL